MPLPWYINCTDVLLDREMEMRQEIVKDVMESLASLKCMCAENAAYGSY
jgi:hypothetical protein